MKCHEAKRALDLFMDGELSVPENMKVLEHLNLCRGCAGVYEGEKALRSGLKSRMGAERAPEGLEARLSRSLAAPVRIPRRRWGTLAAAGLFFTLASALLFTPVAESPRLLASELTDQYQATRDGYRCEKARDHVCLCHGCCSDARQTMKEFFESNGCSDFCSHDLKELGYATVGAAILPHRGNLIRWTIMHDHSGHTLIHALVPTPVAVGAKPLLLSEFGRVLLFVPRGTTGMTCIFIFDGPEEARRFTSMMGMKEAPESH
jgi:hypothetical protein